MPPPAISDLEKVFKSVIAVSLAGAGIAVLIMLLIGGFKFLTAGGDKEATQKAQGTLTYATIGLVVILSSWVILNFLGNFLGLNFSNFSICLPGSTAGSVVGSGCKP